MKAPSNLPAIKMQPGNIYSGTRGLAVFTNPTEIARWKGSIRHSYPISFGSRWYKDAEAAYQANKTAYKGKPDGLEQLSGLVVLAKLTAYPFLPATIKLSGGVEWIEKCRHIVGHGRGWWEGEGFESPFIRSLAWAYKECK